MTRLTTAELIEHGFIQVNGMKKFTTESQQAPFKTDQIEENTKKVQALKTHQEEMKAGLQKATQDLATAVSQLEEELARNINYYIAMWGKHDKRLLEVGGHPAGTRHKHAKDVPVAV